MSVVVGYVPTREGETALDHAAAEARARKTRLVVVNTSRGDGVEHLVVHAMRGREASEEILAVAQEHRAELVVIGLRRRSPVGKLLMGSTARRVLLDAPCPVLAVKP